MKKIIPFIFLLMSLCAGVRAQTPMYSVCTGSSGNYIPLGNNSGTWADQRAQFLYLAGEFGSVPVGFITKIYFKANNSVSNATYTNFRVDIGQNSTTTSLSAAAWVPGLTTCMTNPSFVVPTVTANQWFEIPLTTPFFFDPSLHLIIDTRQTNTTPATAIILNTGAAALGGNRRAWAASAAATPGGADGLYYCFGFDLIAGFPCTGVPVTGVTGPNKTCPNKNFNVSFTTFWTGVTRQWQKSTNGSTWNNFTGTVNATTGAITDAITVPSWYRCIVTCNATSQSYTTPPHFVDIAPFYYCYCEGSKSTTAAGIDIGNTKVVSYPGGDILLNQGNPNPFLSNANANKTYSDFRDTVLPTPMYHDSSYRLFITQTNSTATFTAATGAIYIDYNRNGRFDPWERALLEPTSQSPPTPGMVTDTFKVPDSAGYGLTGMRVILRNGSTAPDTCSSYTDGETEDYLIDLRYMPCSGKPPTGKIEGDTSMCANYDYILTDSTYEKFRHGIDKLWQISADGIYWTNIAGSNTKDTLERIFTGQPLYYRTRFICTHTNDTAFTPVHRVNQKPAYKCYCYSQSTGGKNDSSDIGGFKLYNFSISDGGAHLANPRAVRKRQDYTDLTPIEMLVDSIYQFYVFHTMPNEFHADGKVTVFIDFDNDHKYDIPQERIFTGFTNVGNHTIIKNIVIPNAAISDVPTGMRVIINNEVAPNKPSDSACGTYPSGETEDYMVIFRRAFPSGVTSLSGMEQVQLYPNPSSDGRFTLTFLSSSVVKEVKLKVTNAMGQLVAQEVYSHEGGRFMQQLDLASVAKGVYFVEIDADGISATKRVVIQ
jgi:hypothetical protein